MPARRLILPLCLTGATTSVSIGAFPVLLPEMGVAVWCMPGNLTVPDPV